MTIIGRHLDRIRHITVDPGHSEMLCVKIRNAKISCQKVSSSAQLKSYPIKDNTIGMQNKRDNKISRGSSFEYVAQQKQYRARYFVGMPATKLIPCIGAFGSQSLVRKT